MCTSNGGGYNCDLLNLFFFFFFILGETKKTKLLVNGLDSVNAFSKRMFLINQLKVELMYWNLRRQDTKPLTVPDMLISAWLQRKGANVKTPCMMFVRKAENQTVHFNANKSSSMSSVVGVAV